MNKNEQQITESPEERSAELQAQARNKPEKVEEESPQFNVQAFFQTIVSLCSASLGLVAALAWNDAIKAALRMLFGDKESIVALFGYAVLATVFAVMVLLLLSRAAAKVGGKSVIERHVEGGITN